MADTLLIQSITRIPSPPGTVLRDIFGHINVRPLHLEFSAVTDPCFPDPLEILLTPVRPPVSSRLDTMRRTFDNV